MALDPDDDIRNEELEGDPGELVPLDFEASPTETTVALTFLKGCGIPAVDSSNELNRLRHHTQSGAILVPRKHFDDATELLGQLQDGLESGTGGSAAHGNVKQMSEVQRHAESAAPIRPEAAFTSFWPMLVLVLLGAMVWVFVDRLVEVLRGLFSGGI